MTSGYGVTGRSKINVTLYVDISQVTRGSWAIAQAGSDDKAFFGEHKLVITIDKKLGKAIGEPEVKFFTQGAG